MNNTEILIGCCGWSYKEDWNLVFYPNSLNQKDFLNFYSKIFPTVEIDSSFYRIPPKKMVESWLQKTTPNFQFSGKLPKIITHDNKLKLNAIKEPLFEYLNNISPIEKNHQMVSHLVQLPPSFSLDESYNDLETFFSFWNEWRETAGKSLLNGQLQKYSWRITVEFRNISWMTERTFELLRKNNVAYCAVIEPLLPPRMDMTCDDLFYLRFHGYGKKPWFNYLFSNEEIEKWSKEIIKVLEKAPKAKHLVYFNNHFSGNAVKNALDLMPKLGISPLNSLESLQQEMTLIKKKKTPQGEKNVSKALPKNSLDKWI